MIPTSVKILGLFGLILAFIASLEGLKCTRDSKVMTKCALSDGANGSLDLAPIFSGGAMNVTSNVSWIPAKTPYSYLFDPSKGIKCSDSSVTCTGGALAMCQINYQTTTYTYVLGCTQTAAYNISASNPTSNMWIVNVTYTGGNSKRQVDVEFVYDAKATKPVYTFISENPMLHYHLRVNSSLVMPSKLSLDPMVYKPPEKEQMKNSRWEQPNYL